MGKKYKAVTTDNLRAILPVDWLLLEAENDPQGVRLIVIEIYNHYRYNCPHLYYISNKAPNELSEADIRRIRHHSEELSPEIKNAMRYELPTDGKPYSEEQLKEGTIFGIFDLAQFSALPKTPFGARIISKG